MLTVFTKMINFHRDLYNPNFKFDKKQKIKLRSKLIDVIKTDVIHCKYLICKCLFFNYDSD